jgi:hypothetical protein
MSVRYVKKNITKAKGLPKDAIETLFRGSAEAHGRPVRIKFPDSFVASDAGRNLD